MDIIDHQKEPTNKSPKVMLLEEIKKLSKFYTTYQQEFEMTKESQGNKHKIEETKIIKLKSRAAYRGSSLIKPSVLNGAFSVKPWLPHGA